MEKLDYKGSLRITSGHDADSLRWQSESDARILAEALQIQKDPERIKNARQAAEHLIQVEEKYLEKERGRVKLLKNLVNAGNGKRIVIPKDKSYPDDFPREIITPQILPRRDREVF